MNHKNVLKWHARFCVGVESIENDPWPGPLLTIWIEEKFQKVAEMIVVRLPDLLRSSMEFLNPIFILFGLVDLFSLCAAHADWG